MEKVLCNVYYNLRCKLNSQLVGDISNYNIGNFENSEDAQKCFMLFIQATHYLRSVTHIKSIDSYEITKIYEPETTKVDYYKSVQEFMTNHPIVVTFLEKSNPTLLEETRKLVQYNHSKQETPNLHDNITDEEDNFC